MDAEPSELLDDLLLERALQGERAPGDAPTVAALVAALDVLRQAPLDDELAGEQAAVARFAAAYVPRPALSPARPGRWGRRSVRGLVIAGGLTVLSATAAAAATGTLPDPVQTLAADTLARVGVDVPRPEGQPAEPADGTGPGSEGTGTGRPAASDPADTDAAPGADDPTSTPGAGGKGVTTPGADAADGADGTDGGPPATTNGSTISSIAQDPALTGQERGAAVSTEASGGQSQAGQHGPAADSPTTPTTPTTAGAPGNSEEHGPPADLPEQAAVGDGPAASPGQGASQGQGATQGQGARGRSAEAGAAGPVGSTTTTSTP